jgi:hypothetical protein
MGLPDGWVTDVPGLSRNRQLTLLGNGVVPCQGAVALAALLTRLPDDPAPPITPKTSGMPHDRPDQEHGALFTIPDAASPVTSGVAYAHTDPAGSDAALTGDAYGWLAGLLPAPAPPVCEHCDTTMVLPASAPVLWTCPACHPSETR